MPAFERLDIEGGAAQTTLASGISNSVTTIPISSATGWPDGSAGPFYFDIGYDPTDPTATYEKVKATGRTGTSITGCTRGVDGSAAASHSAGDTVRHTFTAVQADEANQHYSDPALDHHTNYLTTGRHDLEARHAFGSALGTPSAAADIGTVAATGSGDDAAREDHVHKVGAGAINDAGMFAASVVNQAAMADDAVGPDELTNPIGLGYLASDVDTTGASPVSSETEVLSTTATVRANRRVLVVAKVAAITDSDADCDYAIVRFKKDGAAFDRQRIRAGDNDDSGGVAMGLDSVGSADTYTYSVTVEPNSGELGVAADATSRLWMVVIDIGST